MTAHARAAARARGRGFTLVEMMVAVAMLVGVMLIVSQVFKISSDAANRIKAQTDQATVAAAIREQVTRLVSMMGPGLLIIESPPATDERPEVPGGEPVIRLRQDRIVFIASGNPGEFQSQTDRPHLTNSDSRSYSDYVPGTSSEALVYFGPMIPLDDNGDPRYLSIEDEPASGGGENRTLSASEWRLGLRAILLGLEQGTSDVNFYADPADELGVSWAQARYLSDDILRADGTVRELPDEFRRGVLDFISSRSTDVASGQAMVKVLDQANLSGGALALEALWRAPYAPTSVSQATPEDFDHYTRHTFVFHPRVADVRIEWTNGRRVDPDGADNAFGTFDDDLSTPWFGLRPDPSRTNTNLASLNYIASMRGTIGFGTSNPDANNPDNPTIETDVFAGTDVTGTNPPDANGIRKQIEWSSGGTTPGENARYRAVWRTDTWRYRPKALRFTFRVYTEVGSLRRDENMDLNEDGIADPGSLATRYGQEFSFVVPVP